MSKLNLHQAQFHEVLRNWQSQRNDINHPTDFVLPIFVGNDDDSIEPIDAMPGVNRYGVNRAVEYLEPLIETYGLRAVLLFPVMTKSDQVQFKTEKSLRKGVTRNGGGFDVDDDDDDDDDVASDQEILSSSNLSQQYSAQQSSSASSTSDEDSRRARVLPERLLETNEMPTQSQNPFLNPENEEEEDHLLSDSNAHRLPTVVSVPQPPSPRVQRIGPSKTSRTLDVKLIRGMALEDKHNPVLRLIPILRTRFPELLIVCDVCLCAFTSTGHCCLFDDHSIGSSKLNAFDGGRKVAATGSMLNQYPISNKVTCQYLALLAVAYARRGCNVVAPSDMQDGSILSIREELKKHRLNRVAILSYSAKFASAFYGPFRNATHNAPQFGDRRAYQLPPGSRGLALKAVMRDIQEGADFVMVKPAGPYLDLVRDIRETHPEYQIAVYQTSGEYSMLKVAAEAGVLDLKLAVNEMLTAYRRAGATMIISYFTPEILRGEL